MKRFLLILLVLFISISFLFIGYNFGINRTGFFKDVLEGQEHHSPPPVVIEPGSGVETASYIIFQDDEGWVYAKNGSTGEIEFSGTDASEIINDAIGNLASGRIFFKKGTYEVGESIQFESADSVWTSSQGVNVVVSTDTSDKQEGTASAKIDVASGATTGLLAYKDFTLTNMNDALRIGFWVKSSIQIEAGELELVLDDTSGCTSPLQNLDFRYEVTSGHYIPADTWVYLHVVIDDTLDGKPDSTRYPTILGSIISVGIYMTTDLEAFTLHIDDLSVLDAGVTMFGKSNIEFSFEQGAIIKLKDNADWKLFQIVESDHIKFTGMLTIDGNRNNQNTPTGEDHDGIYFYRSDYGVVTNAYIHDTWGDGVTLRKADYSHINIHTKNTHHPALVNSWSNDNNIFVESEGGDLDGAIWVTGTSERNQIHLIARNHASLGLRLWSENCRYNIAWVTTYNVTYSTIYGDYNELHLLSRDNSGNHPDVSVSGDYNKIFLTAIGSTHSFGAYITGDFNELISPQIYDVTTQGVYISGSNNTITGGTINGYGSYGVRLTSTAIGNRIEGVKITGGQYGVHETSGADYNLIIGNDIRGNSVQGVLKVGANSEVWRNIGFVSENSGTATGTSPITVAHGLSETPSVVVVTPRTSCAFAVTSRDATNFEITHDGGSVTFDWYAEYEP